MNQKKLLCNETGASAVEFALVLLPLMMLVMGAIEFGTLFYDKHLITNASREAARAGIVQGNPRIPAEDAGAVKGFLPVGRAYLNNSNGKSLLLNYKNLAQVPVVATPTGACTNIFQLPLTVTVNYTYDYLFLSSLPGFPASVALNASTTMLCE